MKSPGLLRRRRHVDYDKPDSFAITSAAAIADTFRQIMSTVALMTVVVSSIGLLVGGVGVMNIMLMSVTERTHEIGVRKAIGARRGDVIRQFLTEAVVVDRTRRYRRSTRRRRRSIAAVTGVPRDADVCTRLGHRHGGGDGGQRRPVLRHVSSGKGCSPRSGRSPSL